MSEIPINLTANLTPDEQYLWDATGTPTPSTLAIESALGQLRFSGKPLSLPHAQPLLLRRWPLLALAAAILLALSLTLYFTLPRPAPEFAGWTLAAATGKPTFGYQPKSKLPDAHIQTDARSTATLEYKLGPTVHLAASSEATLAHAPQVHLASGTADIEVPPTVTGATVSTPAVSCSLAPGCAATVESNNGVSQVRITKGWAEVASGKDTLRLSSDMACSSQPKSDSIWPPYRLTKGDTSAALIKQLDDMSHIKGDEKKQYMILQEVLKSAKPQDAALLWNLFPRVQDWQREAIRNRLAKLVKEPPKGKAFDDVLKLEKDAMEAWWNSIINN